MQTSNVGWSKIEKLVDELTVRVTRIQKQFDSISTISRGGLVPARLMADSLGVKKIYVDQNVVSSKSLFVDDIYDTGNTFQKIIKKTENPTELIYATLLARIGKQYPKQLVYAEKTIGNEYIIFPWEKHEQESK